MKGVSEVIAIILILMITISLAGLAYTFMSATISSTTSAASSAVTSTTSSMLTSFAIESIDVAKVYVRNTGQNALSALSVYVNDEPAIFNITPSTIAEGQVGTVTIYSFIPDGATVRITSPSGFSTSKVANPCSKAVGCWKFDEAYAEVSPAVLADDDLASYFSPTSTFSSVPENSLSNDNTIQQSGANCLKVVLVHALQYSSWIHYFGSNQDWSSKSVITFRMYGANSGKTLSLKVQAVNTTNYYSYLFTDSWTGWRTISIPRSSFTAAGSPSWSSVKAFEMLTASTDTTATWYFDRFVIDDGVPAADSSGNGNDGTLMNMVIGTNVSGPTVGKHGNGLLFDGVNDYVSIPPEVKLINQSFTLASWMKPYSLSGTYQMFGPTQWNMVGIGLAPTTNQIFVQFNSGGLNIQSSGITPVAGSWYYVVSTFDWATSTLRIYVNGALASSWIATNPTFSWNDFSIGSQASHGNPFNGMIDEVRIYNRAIY